jgi:glycosyltransferase involved in cell wall biosynthesis
MPLRIAMLTTFYPPWSFGGDAIQVQRLSQALAAQGHEITVIHSREGYAALAGRGADVPPARERDGDVRLVAIDAGLGVLSPLTTYLSGRPLLARRQLEAALEQPFDVLHFHNPSLLGGPGVLGMGEAAVRVMTLHEQWLVCPTHVLWKYGRRVCEKPTCVRCTLTYKRPPQPWRGTGLLERSLACVDALIAPSATTARLHARLAKHVAIERLPHFLPDPGAVAPGSGIEPDEPPHFLYVGRFERIKGVERAIDAFRGRSERLVLAGSGTLEHELRQQARGLDNVRFAGWVAQDELDGLYRGARALVLPTVGHESFPLVLLEAFARGVPAIVPEFGALGELAAESGAALTYRSADELARCLDALSADDALRAELGTRGRASYEAKWTTAIHLREYAELIARLAERGGHAELATRTRSGALA